MKHTTRFIVFVAKVANGYSHDLCFSVEIVNSGERMKGRTFYWFKIIHGKKS